MGGSSQSKSAYNQARSTQNWEQNQYTSMFGPNGSQTQAYAPTVSAGNTLLASGGLEPGVASGVQSNENAANTAIGQGEQAAQQQGANTVASEYSNLLSGLKQQQTMQGGYMPGYGASSESLAQNAAQQEANAAEAPAEQAASQYQTQANTNASNALALGSQGLAGTQLGSELSTSGAQNQLNALGMTEGDLNNIISTEGNIGSTIGSPLQDVSSIAGSLNALGSAAMGGAEASSIA